MLKDDGRALMTKKTVNAALMVALFPGKHAIGFLEQLHWRDLPQALHLLDDNFIVYNRDPAMTGPDKPSTSSTLIQLIQSTDIDNTVYQVLLFILAALAYTNHQEPVSEEQAQELYYWLPEDLQEGWQEIGEKARLEKEGQVRFCLEARTTIESNLTGEDLSWFFERLDWLIDSRCRLSAGMKTKIYLLTALLAQELRVVLNQTKVAAQTILESQDAH